MRRAHLILAVVATGLCPMIAAGDYDAEYWDVPGKANNNWSYYDTDVPSPHNVDMTWHASGGMGDTGYVSAPLALLDSAHDPCAFWPAYLYRGLGVAQEIDLSFPGAVIKVRARDMAPPTQIQPMDLKGGSLVFFIGQWVDVGDDGNPANDKWSFFHNLTPVTIAQGGWTVRSSLPVGGNADWAAIADNDPLVDPSDLFYHPQQWGFAIFPAASTPTGTLGLDSLRIVPEPASFSLVALGAAVLLGRRKKRS